MVCVKDLFRHRSSYGYLHGRLQDSLQRQYYTGQGYESSHDSQNVGDSTAAQGERWLHGAESGQEHLPLLHGHLQRDGGMVRLDPTSDQRR